MGALLATLLIILFLIVGGRSSQAETAKINAASLKALEKRNEISAAQLTANMKSQAALESIAFWVDRQARRWTGINAAARNTGGPTQDPQAGKGGQ